MSAAWCHLESVNDLDEILEISYRKPVAIFKHSTRCAISSLAWQRIENARIQTDGTCQLYFLDLISYRALSDRIATDFSVKHESPQVLLVRNGQCIFTASHNGIDPLELTERFRNAV